MAALFDGRFLGDRLRRDNRRGLGLADGRLTARDDSRLLLDGRRGGLGPGGRF